MVMEERKQLILIWFYKKNTYGESRKVEIQIKKGKIRKVNYEKEKIGKRLVQGFQLRISEAKTPKYFHTEAMDIM